MSCLQLALALACLAAVTESGVRAVADIELRNFICSQLQANEVIKSEISLSDVSGEKYKLSNGVVSYGDLSVIMALKTANQLFFAVTGKATCYYRSFVKDNKEQPIWISTSPREKNCYIVTLDVNIEHCIIEKTSVINQRLNEIDTGRTEKGEFVIPLVKISEVSTEVDKKLTEALKTAAGSVDLGGAGFAGC